MSHMMYSFLMFFFVIEDEDTGADSVLSKGLVSFGDKSSLNEASSTRNV